VRIAVDVDGVLAQLHLAVIRRVEEQYRIKITADQIRRWATIIQGVDLAPLFYEMAGDPDVVKSLKPVSGAQEGMTALSQLGHDLVIATSRRETGDKSVKQWLKRQAIPYDEYVNTMTLGGKQHLDCDMLVDDYSGNLLKFINGQDQRKGILLCWPWSEPENLLSVRSKTSVVGYWHQVIEQVKMWS